MGFQDRLATRATTGKLAFPQTFKRPASGDNAKRGVLTVRNGKGAMEDADNDRIFVRVLQSDGTVLTTKLYEENALSTVLAASGSSDFPTGSAWVQTDASAKVGTGQYEFFYKASTGDSEEELTIEFGWEENGVPNSGYIRFRIADAADVDTIDTNVSGIATDIGDPSGDTLTDLTSKMGDTGDASTANSMLGLLGDPTDAAVASDDGTEGSLFGKIRDISSKAGGGQIIIDDFVQITGTTSSTVFASTNLTSAVDDFYNGMMLLYRDTSDGSVVARRIMDYVGATKTVTISSSPGVSVSTADFISIVGQDPTTGDWLGDPSSDTLTSFRDKVGDTGDASTTNSLLGLLGQPTDSAIESSDGTEGSLFGKIRDIGGDTAGIGNPSIDTLTTLTAKLGDTGDASTTNSVLGLLGQPTDANVNVDDGTEGSLFGKLRDVGERAMGPVLEGPLDVTGSPTTTSIPCTGLPNGTANDFYNGCMLVIEDASASGAPRQVRRVTDYVSATKTFTLERALNFTPSEVTPDRIWIVFGDVSLADLITNVGNPSIDTLNTLTAKLGDQGDASTTNNLLGLLGDPTDAAVAADDGTEGSLFAKIRDIASNVGGSADSVLISGTIIPSKSSEAIFTLTAGSTVDDFYNGMLGVVEDVSAGTFVARRIIDYVGSTKTVTLEAVVPLTIETTVDKFSIIANDPTVTSYLGDPSGDTLTSLTAKLGDSGDASTTNNLLGLLGDPTDAAVAADDGTEGSLFGKIRDIGGDTAGIGNPSIDTLTTLTAKLGDTGDASTTNSVLGLLGQPTDAAVDAAGGTEGSIFGKLRDIATELDTHALASGTRRGNFDHYLVNGDNEITADPTDAEVSASGTNDAETAEVMHIIDIDLPETTGATIEAIFAVLKWTSQVTTGSVAGVTKWMISPDSATETVGSVPSGGAVDVTDDVTATTSKTTHTRSGVIRSSAIPATNGIRLLLVGLAGGGVEVQTASIFESSVFEISYSVG